MSITDYLQGCTEPTYLQQPIEHSYFYFVFYLVTLSVFAEPETTQ